MTWTLASSHVRAEWSGLLVPAYFSPSRGNDWQALASAAAEVPLIAIANVQNGPGRSARAEYRDAISRVRAMGGRVVGYVHTTYTRRPRQEVLDDIDRWSEFYPLDGIFVDEMTNDGQQAGLEYFRALRDHAKQKGSAWLVVGNPGTHTREAYLTNSTADVLVTFEHHEGYPGYTADPWMRRHPPTAFAHLCYDVPSAAVMFDFLVRARDRGATWIYITDDRAPNPWDRLPGYWTQEVGRIREMNQAEPVRVAVAPGGLDSVQLNVESVPGRYVVESSTDLQTWSEWYAAGAPLGRLEVVIPTTTATTRFLRVRR